MVHVGRVWVGVVQRAVVVRVAVRAGGHGAVAVQVVAVVVGVGVFVVHGLVIVVVAVVFCQVDQHPGHHEPAAREQQPAGRALAQRERTQGADEGRERKHRPGARGAKAALRQQIEAQAQAVAGGAHGEQKMI